MNRAELKQAIEDSQGPASEAARFVDQLDDPPQCPHYQDGKCVLVNMSPANIKRKDDTNHVCGAGG